VKNPSEIKTMPQEFQTSGTTTPPRSQASKTEQQAKQASQKVGDQGGRAAEALQEQLGSAAQSVRAATTDAAHRAKEGAQSFIARQKDMAAAEISHLGEAVQRAAEKLHEEEDHNIASYAEAAATRARSAAEYLQQHEVHDLLADMQSIARRHPAVVCGGMFAAGVAVARFLKATSPAPDTRRSNTGIENWQGTQRQAISSI
jgi:hypothetical protein